MFGVLRRRITSIDGAAWKGEFDTDRIAVGVIAVAARSFDDNMAAGKPIMEFVQPLRMFDDAGFERDGVLKMTERDANLALHSHGSGDERMTILHQPFPGRYPEFRVLYCGRPQARAMQPLNFTLEHQMHLDQMCDGLRAHFLHYIGAMDFHRALA